ncbi:MAG: AAA family ATPase [Parasporobacterium sp.]|jgi:AAA+ ATPase superfamily predicted ATPase|nr:AAA family ATPase [Parasporobacterium sp.]
MLIGREREIKKLKELYCNDSAELVAVYGRRRVGKTYLIDEALAGKFTFRHAGLSPAEYRGMESEKKKNRLKDQLDHFYQSLLMQGMKRTAAPQSWLEAFYMLEVFLQEKEKDTCRILVFLDEIQWLDTPKSGFMTGLEAFWNNWACHKHNVMVVVCGSSSSWILDKLINNHGGLYGRVTCQINLQPFTLHECELFFEAKGVMMSRYDIVQAYMTVGGIPYYLNYFKRELSLSQNIQEMFFAPGAPLANEFDRLFSSLFVNAEVMQSIVRALNTKNRGLTRAELLNITGIPESGEFSRYLDALITGTFIIRYYSFGNGKRESFYKLADPFCIYYLKFVEGNTGKTNVDWVALSDTQAVTSWKGLAFENVCFNHIKQIKSSLGISGVSTSESLWSKRGSEDAAGTQIDLIIERKDNVLNMCEMKFYSQEFTVTKEYHFILERRKSMLYEKVSKKTSVHNTLITTFGLKHTEYFSDIVNTITLEDLFQK